MEVRKTSFVYLFSLSNITSKGTTIFTGCSETEFHIENSVIFDVELSCSNYVIFEIVCFKTEFHIQKHKKLEILIVRIRNYIVQCTGTAVHTPCRRRTVDASEIH